MTSFFVGFVIGYAIASVVACVIFRNSLLRHNAKIDAAANTEEGGGDG